MATLRIERPPHQAVPFDCVVDTGHPWPLMVAYKHWKWFATRFRTLQPPTGMTLSAGLTTCNVAGQIRRFRPGFLRIRIQDFLDSQIVYDCPNEVFALFEDVGIGGSALDCSIIGIGSGLLERASIHIDTPNSAAWLEL